MIIDNSHSFLFLSKINMEWSVMYENVTSCKMSRMQQSVSQSGVAGVCSGVWSRCGGSRVGQWAEFPRDGASQQTRVHTRSSWWDAHTLALTHAFIPSAHVLECSCFGVCRLAASPPRCLVLDCSHVSSIDFTVVHELTELLKQFQLTGLSLIFTGLKVRGYHQQTGGNQHSCQLSSYIKISNQYIS